MKPTILILSGALLGFGLQGLRMRPQVIEAQRIAAEANRLAREQSDAAKGWEHQYQQVYPLARQWRMGYEALKQKCGE